MQTFPALFRRIYNTPACIAVIPSVAVIIDYTLTFFLAANTGMILQWEASPLVRFAVAHNIMAIYLLAIVLFYFGAAYAILLILRPTCYYKYSVALVVLLSITHVMGGLSWQLKNTWYSDSVIALSLITVIITICLFGYSFLRKECFA